MIKLLYSLFFLLTLTITASAQNRFPKPDFESGYQYPAITYNTPDETLLTTIDMIVLVLMMSVVAMSVVRRKRRAPVIIVSVISVAYFGFYRSGCVCSVGSIQNIALALADPSYAIPLSALLFFVLPILFALLFGRVFCAGVCPMGALQELVNVKSMRLSRPVAATLGVIPWIYLSFTVLYAATRSNFIVCRFDPFIGIFRMGGDLGMILFGAALLVASIFTGRPFCRFLCPYGALLSLFARLSVWRIRITPSCNSCDLCSKACPVDAIRPPYGNKVSESRARGMKRVLAYLIFIPVTTIAGALLLRMSGDALSRGNRDVRLYSMVASEAKATEEIPLEVEVFLAQGGTPEALAVRVDGIRRTFVAGATFAGAFIGMIFGLTLVGLSLKRTRKAYEIDEAACVNCGRCFDYCPQNRPKPISKKISN
jgi:ferredoxin